MFSTLSNLRFKPHWFMTLLATLFVLLFLRLGYWQINRAHEKEHMLAAQDYLSHQAPTPLSTDDPNPKQYQPLSVTGHFLPQVFLFDNQHYQHQFGYNVLSPLVLDHGQVILVDRGWIAGDMKRIQLPKITVPTELIELTGTVYYPSEKNWLLGQVLEKKTPYMSIVELIDTALISQFLHKSVYPFIIRLDKQAKYGFIREWAVVAMSPDRHYGYALQWFSMGLVIIILFIALNIQSVKKST